MSTQTLNAPQIQNGETGSRARRAPSTPRSMVPPSAGAAVSTPVAIDFAAVVKEIMKVDTKNTVGTVRLVSNKSKQHIFALACKAVRSLRGIEPVTVVENGVSVTRPGRLDAADEKALRDAIMDVWKAELLSMLTFGGDVTECDLKTVKNQTMSRFTPADKSNVKDASGNARADVDYRLKFQAVVTRAPKTVQEAIFTGTIELGKAEKRLKFMQDNPAKYTGEDVRLQHNIISTHEWKLLQLKDLLALEQRQAAAVAALDAQKAAGQVDEAQYAIARKAIESAVV